MLAVFADTASKQQNVKHADILGQSGDMVRAQAESTLLPDERGAGEASKAGDAQPDTLPETGAAGAAEHQLWHRSPQLTSIPEGAKRPEQPQSNCGKG